jgi:hypothetical protein
MKGKTAIVAAGIICILTASTALAQMSDKDKVALIAKGKYLVNLAGCNHCHSPKVMAPQGPVVDETRPLSGTPSTMPVALPAEGMLAPDKWGIATTMDLTAWAGPWGVSFARNLTPDKETGLGSWTEAMFIKALRTGKDMGEGRPILPPMPWEDIGHSTDSDLHAIFAYLQSLKPIKNAVHDPIPPPAAPGGGH